MYIIFKEIITEGLGTETIFMFPYTEGPSTLDVRNFVSELNYLIPIEARNKVKVKSLYAGEYDIDLSRPTENIYLVARLRNGKLEKILELFNCDMSATIKLLNSESENKEVTYIGSWIKGTLN